MAHIPKDVLAKNFQTNMTAFNEIPGSELYIFPSGETTSSHEFSPRYSPTRTESPSPEAVAVTNPQGQVPSPFTYSFSNVTAMPLSGGSAKIADSTVFPISTQIAVAEVTVAPGAMRELHVSVSC